MCSNCPACDHLVVSIDPSKHRTRLNVVQRQPVLQRFNRAPRGLGTENGNRMTGLLLGLRSPDVRRRSNVVELGGVLALNNHRIQIESVDALPHPVSATHDAVHSAAN
jgi:hypothetical protein